jgi:ADP-heptose:LPS heptosyltransferase
MGRRVLFNINGGIGRVIAATGAIKRLKEREPDTEINILTGFPDIFANNPFINRIYPFSAPYLFEDVVMKNEYFEPEPYTRYEFYAEKESLATMFNLLINNEREFVKPEIFLTDVETKNAEIFVKSRSREMVLIQPFGAMGGRGVPDESLRSLREDFAEKLCKKLNEKYDTFLIKAPDQKGWEGIMTFNNPIRQIIALIPFVKAVISCDSFLHHACEAMNKPCFVFWCSTRHENFGYENNLNYRKHAKFVWTPVRIFMNDPSIWEKDKHVNQFDDTDIDKVLEWVETQSQIVKPEGKDSCEKPNKEVIT